MTYRVDVSREWLEEQYTNKKLSITCCAKACGLSPSTVRNRLIRYDIPIRPLSESQKLLGGSEQDYIDALGVTEVQDMRE